MPYMTSAVRLVQFCTTADTGRRRRPRASETAPRPLALGREDAVRPSALGPLPRVAPHLVRRDRCEVGRGRIVQRILHDDAHDFVWFTPAANDDDPCERYREMLEKMNKKHKAAEKPAAP